MQFHETNIGERFFTNQLPRLITAFENLVKVLEKKTGKKLDKKEIPDKGEQQE